MEEYLFYDGGDKQEAIDAFMQKTSQIKYNEGVESFNAGMTKLSTAQEMFDAGKIDFAVYKKAVSSGESLLGEAVKLTNDDYARKVRNAAAALAMNLARYDNFSDYAKAKHESDLTDIFGTPMKPGKYFAAEREKGSQETTYYTGESKGTAEPFFPVKDYAATATERVVKGSIPLPDAEYNRYATKAAELAQESKYKAYIYLRNSISDTFQRDVASILNQIGITAEEAAALESQYLAAEKGQFAALDPVLAAAYAQQTAVQKTAEQQRAQTDLEKRVERLGTGEINPAIQAEESLNQHFLDMLFGEAKQEAADASEVEKIENAIRDYTLRSKAARGTENPTVGDAILEGVVSGIGQFAQGINWYGNMTAEKTPAERFNEYRISELYNNMNGVEKTVFDLTASVVNNGISLAAGAVVGSGAASSAVFGTSIFGNDMRQSLAEGKSFGNALIYSAINTAMEVGLERALGGIGRLSSRIGQKAITSAGGKVLSAIGGKLSTAVSRFFNTTVGGNVLKRLGSAFLDMGSEAFEEWLQEWIDPFVRNLIYGENNEIDPFGEQALRAGFLGALSAGILNLPNSVSQIAGTPSQYVYSNVGQAIREGKAQMTEQEYIAEAKELIQKDYDGYDLLQKDRLTAEELGQIAVETDLLAGRAVENLTETAEARDNVATARDNVAVARDNVATVRENIAKTEQEIETDVAEDRLPLAKAEENEAFKWVRRELNKNSTAKTVKSPGEITAEAEKLFDIPINTGKYAGKNSAYGVYKNKLQAIRESRANNLPTIAHELGHFFDDLYRFRNWPDTKDEVLAVLMNTRNDWILQYSDRAKPREAVAEFFREYLSSREDAAAMYPKFYQAFQDYMKGDKARKKMLERIDRLGDDINKYLSLESLDRARASMVSYEQKKTAIQLAQKGIDGLKKIRTAFDDKAPLMYAGQSVYERAYMAIKADGISNTIITKYVIGPDRGVLKKDGKPIYGLAYYVGQVEKLGAKEINGKPIGKRKVQEDFELYLKARQNESGYKLAYDAEEQKQLFTDPTVDSLEKTQEIIAALDKEYPTFRKLSDGISDMYQAFYKAWIVKGGNVESMVSPEKYAEITANRDFYLPVIRKTETSETVSQGKRASQTNRGLFRRRGGGDDTIAPIEGVARRIGELVLASERNAIYAEASEQCRKMTGGASYMEKITPSRIMDKLTTKQKEAVANMIFSRLSVEQQKAYNLLPYLKRSESARQKFAELSEEDLRAVRAVANMILELETSTATTDFSQINPFQGDDVIKIWKHGKAEYWQLNDEDFAKALGVINNKEQLGTVMRGIKFMNKTFKRFTTGLAVGFAFVRNPVRDFQTGFLFNKYTRNPLKYTADHFKALKEVIEGKRSERKMMQDFRIGVEPELDEGYYNEWLRAGGGFSGRITSNRVFAETMNTIGLWTDETLQDAFTAPLTMIEKLAKAPGLLLKSAGKIAGAPFRLIENVSETLEAVPRVAEYTRAFDSGKTPAQAVRDADEITVNFARGGRFSRTVDLFLPYFNASAQSLWRVIDQVETDVSDFQNARGVKAKTESALRSAPVTSVYWSVIQALAIVGWNHLMGADDEYAKLSSYQKNNYYCLYIGRGEFFKLAKAHELSALESVFERLGETVGGNDAAWYKFPSYLANQLLMSGMPDITNFYEGGLLDILMDTGSNMLLLGGLLDVARNEDYLGRKIVPESVKNLKPSAQVKDTTTAGGKLLSSIFGGSPIQWDYLISSYLPTIGTLLSYTSGAKTLSKGLTGLMIADPVYSNDAQNKFYDEKSTADAEYATDKSQGVYAAASKQANAAAAVLSALRKKETEDPDNSYDIRKAERDFADGIYRSLYTADQRIVDLYERTGNISVMPWREYGETITVEIDGNKVQRDLSADEILSNYNTYTLDVLDYYDEALAKGYSDEELTEILLRLKDIAAYNVKNMYFDESTDVQKWVAVSDAGVSALQYAEAKEFYQNVPSNEKGSKVENVVAWLNSKNFTDDQKKALMKSFGYADSTIAKYFSAGTQRDLPDWVSDILGGVA